MKKIAFFHFPKAAGSFLLNYINEFLNDYFYNAKHHKYTDIKEKINSLYKIAFVRNPFAWYVSRYFYFAREVSRVEGGISIQCDSGLWGKEFTDKFPMPEHHILWGLKEVPNFSFTYRFNEMFLDENGKSLMEEPIGDGNILFLEDCKIQEPDENGKTTTADVLTEWFRGDNCN